MSKRFYKLMIVLIAFIMSILGCGNEVKTAADVDKTGADSDLSSVDNGVDNGNDDSDLTAVDYTKADDDIVLKNDIDGPAMEYGPIQTDFDNKPLTGDEDQMTAEYGCPSAEYIAEGKVTDNLDAPIVGIEISYDAAGKTGTVTTGQYGKFSITEQITCSGNISGVIKLKAKDVDGSANGQFWDTNSDVTLDHTDMGSGWDKGTYEKHDIQVKMDEMPATDYGVIATKFKK